MMQDRETFFSEALQKWSQLNCTIEFVSFEREVRTKVDTLAQLVYHKVHMLTHHFICTPQANRVRHMGGGGSGLGGAYNHIKAFGHFSFPLQKEKSSTEVVILLGGQYP
jgi:hypothetical protein